MPARKDLRRAGAEIERKEQRAPPLVLAHVGVLMRPFLRQDLVTDAEYDVPERDGQELHGRGRRTGERCQTPTGHLEYALTDAHARPEGARDKGEGQSDQGGRCCPDVAGETEDATSSLHEPADDTAFSERGEGAQRLTTSPLQ